MLTLEQAYNRAKKQMPDFIDDQSLTSIYGKGYYFRLISTSPKWILVNKDTGNIEEIDPFGMALESIAGDEFLGLSNSEMSEKARCLAEFEEAEKISKPYKYLVNKKVS